MHSHLRIDTQMHTHNYIYMYKKVKRNHTRTQSYMNMQESMHAQMYIYRHERAQTCMHTYVYECVYVQSVTKKKKNEIRLFISIQIIVQK